MIRVAIIGRDGVGWSIDKERVYLEHFFSSSSEIKLVNNYFLADVYYVMWYDQTQKLLMKFFLHFAKFLLKKKIVAVITNDIICEVKEIDIDIDLIDLWLAPNKKIFNFLKQKSLDCIYIPFFVSSKSFFKDKRSKQEIAKELNIDYSKLEGKVIIGSFQRDSLGSDLMKPKWQKDPDTLISICKKLPKDSFVLVLAGPRRHYIISQCVKYGIPFLFVGDDEYIKNCKDDIYKNNLSENEMNLLYNLIDLYLISSSSEGGPKSILEASLTKTLIMTTNVGFAEDFLSVDNLYNKEDLNTVVENILSILSDHDRKNRIIENQYKKVITILDYNYYLGILEKAIKFVFYKECK